MYQIDKIFYYQRSPPGVDGRNVIIGRKELFTDRKNKHTHHNKTQGYCSGKFKIYFNLVFVP